MFYRISEYSTEYINASSLREAFDLIPEDQISDGCFLAGKGRTIWFKGKTKDLAWEKTMRDLAKDLSIPAYELIDLIS